MFYKREMAEHTEGDEALWRRDLVTARAFGC